MEIETIEIHKYKTSDGKTFDDKAEAVRHERTQIVIVALAGTVMPDDERARTIDLIVDKFDRLMEDFDTADVLNIED